MPKDIIHDALKQSLLNEGWNITEFSCLSSKIVDAIGDCLIHADRKGVKIAIEVNGFSVGPSAISQLHNALWQYINYRGQLALKDRDRVLYLAVSNRTYDAFLKQEFPRSMLMENQVNLLVYDVRLGAIKHWIN